MLITHPCMYDCIERKRMPVKGKSGKNTSDMIPVMFSCLILFAVPCLLARINMAASETLPRNSAQGTSVPAEDALADQYNTPDSVFYHRDVLPEVHINQDYLTNQYDYGIACFLWDIYGQAASIFDQLYYTASQPVYINHPLFSEHSTYEYLNLDLLASSMTFHISGNYSRSYETLKLIDPEPLPADHPLWDCRNCLVTPHVAGLFRQLYPFRRIVERSVTNLGHFVKGEPLESVVDLATGYRVSRS